MKLAVLFVVIGVALVADGTIRIVEGIVAQNASLGIAGMVTGWLLGGWFILRGVKRWKLTNTDVTSKQS